VSGLPQQELFETIQATWPPADAKRLGNWTIRDGQGGGNRVSATTLDGAKPEDIAAAEAAMDDLNQPRLFMVRQGQEELDQTLAERGYEIKDPTTAYACPVGTLTDMPVPPVSAFSIWPPLAIQREIWHAGGVGPSRLAVMERVAWPKTSILARANDRPAGTAFVALQRKSAMFHALEVVPEQRRKGVGNNILRAAAHWAQDHGAEQFYLLVTDANRSANALYCSAGMSVVGRYHYRVRQ
jgi:GNAT superfamily N-acetyltransferase